MQPPDPVWPLRLLHVSSMTSYQHDMTNSYGGIREPPYNAISYTWVAFKQDGGTALQIQDVSWKVPLVNSNHFTIQEFEATINAATSGCQWLLLDIACIDQQEDVKIEEIGNQADILKRASHVSVWLTPWTT